MRGLVFILLFAFLLLLLTFYFNYDTEKYQNFNSYGTEWDLLSPDNIGDCYRYNNKDCLKYSNCGLCNGKCIPGDYNGPFFKLGCEDWKYYDYYMNKVNETIPFDKKFPSYYYRYGALNNFVGI